MEKTVAELTESLEHIKIAASSSSREKHLRHAKVVGIPCDVSNPEDVKNLATFAAKELGSIDIWVRNVAYFHTLCLSKSLNVPFLQRSVSNFFTVSKCTSNETNW